MKKTFTTILLFITIGVFGQSKKEQIAILEDRVDSLIQVLNNEKIDRATTEKELQAKLLILNDQLINLQTEKNLLESNLTEFKKKLNKQEEENQKVIATLTAKEKELITLEEKFNKTSDELIEQLNLNETHLEAQKNSTKDLEEKEEEIIELRQRIQVLSEQIAGLEQEKFKAEDAGVGKNEKTAEEGPNTGNVKWDKILDEYDAYVIEYVKFYKKAMNGDMSAISKYPALLEKATKLSESINEAQNSDQLNQKQISRFIQIQTKLMDAVGY